MQKLNSLILLSSILYSDQSYSAVELRNGTYNDLQETTPPVTEPCPAPDDSCCSLDCFTDVQNPCSTLTLRHIDPGGFGYCEGYTTLEGLVFPFCNICDNWIFINLRAHYFNNNEWAGNIGGGFRNFNPCTHVAYGINTYFDFRTDCHRDFFFPQIGVGLERLGECWDIRVNGYFPFNRTKLHKHCHFNYPGGFFIDQKKYRASSTGFDVELGRYFFHTNCFQLYGAVGPYYYGRTGCSSSFVGGRARAILSYTRHLTLEGFVTYDHKYKTNFQGSIAIHIPFGCCPSKGLKQDILSQGIRRNEIIVIDQFCKWKFNF